MKRSLSVISLLFGLSSITCFAQTEVTTQEAASLYRSVSKKRVSIHDPSVVYEPSNQRYYVFGSHKAGAYTTDMQNWTQANPSWSPNDNATAFVTPAVKKVKNKDGEEVDFPQFNAMDWSARSDAAYNIDGNMWAPDVIWNPTMNKWCMYLSINGDSWHSSIILLTSSSIQGPYRYQGPVVISGFKDSSHSYKDTDLELALGSLSTMPSRYNVGNNWGRRWPHTIDPAVFYDEEGQLWLVYGSWSGGIWVLQLDEETGLRDYTVSYPSTNGTSDGVTSDPYFGTKIAGGYYVSGEGPYIEHIGDYYYLFVSYGGFAPDGGYEMRVFRSSAPNGPYKDASNRSAIFTCYVLNYGTGSETRGEKLMGSYNGWGFQTVGECAQGHNSIIAADDGRTYLVYHTKFNNGTIGHQVRVHQVFQNKNGWLVAAPFEYNGEQTTDADIASTELVSDVQIPGIYQILVHKYKMDHANMEEVTPITITLTDDGKVTGAYNGTWSREAGTSYLSIKLGNITYNGVITVQQMDTQNVQSIAFTAMANSGVNVWGYKMHPKYAVAWHVNNQKAPVNDRDDVNHNVDLYKMNLGIDNVTLQWSSSHPDIISDYGRYNPTGLADDTPVTLTARLTSADYYWQQAFAVNALSEQNAQPSADWTTGLLAHYGFGDEGSVAPLSNTFNSAELAQLLSNGTAKAPELEGQQTMRNGNIVHLNFGANGKESYVAIQNPLFGKPLEEGATIAFWVQRTDNNLWDALFGFTRDGARLYMTGNTYVGYNGGDDDWLDINHPNSVTPTQLPVGSWHFVIVTFERTARSSSGGVTVYVDGNRSFNDVFNGMLGSTTVSTRRAFDYNHIVDHIAASPQFYLGNGSFWGSPDAHFDDVMFYDHALSSQSIAALNTMTNRVFDYSTLTNGIPSVVALPQASGQIYDLQGRRISAAANSSKATGRRESGNLFTIHSSLKKGLYIIGGKKIVIR